MLLNGSGSYAWGSSGYWGAQESISLQPNTSPASYRTTPHAYPAPLEYNSTPSTNTFGPTSAPALLYPLQYDTTPQHYTPYHQHAYAPYAHHAIEDISYWPNSLSSYGYQPTEYMGTGEVPYGDEGVPFGPSEPNLQAASSSDARTTTPAEQPVPEREYKCSTEEGRHSPCKVPALTPRSPPQ